jgi:hypothetical protein
MHKGAKVAKRTTIYFISFLTVALIAAYFLVGIYFDKKYHNHIKRSIVINIISEDLARSLKLRRANNLDLDTLTDFIRQISAGRKIKMRLSKENKEAEILIRFNSHESTIILQEIDAVKAVLIFSDGSIQKVNDASKVKHADDILMFISEVDE